MSFFAFVLIVSSAILHASWNLMAKKNQMTVPYYAIICTVAPILWWHTFLWTPVQVTALPLRFWLCVGGCVLSEIVYCHGLMLTYRHWEMSTAYPVMRSLPILLTVCVTSLLGLGKALGVCSQVGMGVVFLGCMMMPLKSFGEFSLRRYVTFSMVFVLLAACGTTGYTLFDSESQKALRSVAPEVGPVAISVTYYTLRDSALTSALWLLTLVVPTYRAQARDYFVRFDKGPWLAGICASATYLLVLFAMNFVDNVSYVQVFRQLGLPVGMIAGILILKESCSKPKIIGVALIVLGLVLSALGRDIDAFVQRFVNGTM